MFKARGTMKKKLLITLGCSITEGYGCFGIDDEENQLIKEATNHRPERVGMVKYTSKGPFDIEKMGVHFNEGWPPKLQKLLNYNHLINLGQSGSSNSYALKRWIEFFSENKIEGYDVLVVWMVTFFGRLSFYVDGRLQNLGHGWGPDKELYENYMKLMNSTEPKDKDLSLENFYCLRTIKYFCDLNGYNFLYINTQSTEGELFEKLETPYSLNENNLNQHYRKVSSSCIIKQEDYNNISFCGHPNEKGYTVIANRLFELIQKHYPQYINDTQPKDYVMQFLGTPKQW